jgi:hypothetical protein
VIHTNTDLLPRNIGIGIPFLGVKVIYDSNEFVFFGLGPATCDQQIDMASWGTFWLLTLLLCDAMLKVISVSVTAICI